MTDWQIFSKIYQYQNLTGGFLIFHALKGVIWDTFRIRLGENIKHADIFSSHKIFNLTKFWLQFFRKMTTLLRFLAVIDFGKTSIYSFRFSNLWVSDHNSNKIRFYCQSPKSCENNHFSTQRTNLEKMVIRFNQI